MRDINFTKIRNNKWQAIEVAKETQIEGTLTTDSSKFVDVEWPELFTIIAEQDGTLTFQFASSILIEPQAGNAINIRFR